MKVRGERECTDCGTRWSYYETGEVGCPDCGSLCSVGIDAERKRHTDASAELDLSPYREAIADADAVAGSDSDTDPVRIEGLDDVDEDLRSTLRSYLRKRGFIAGGELRPLDDTYLGARELLEAVDCYLRLREPTEEATLYVLSLLGVDTGRRPDPDDVPSSMREARGMAVARSVKAYREELGTYLDDRGGESLPTDELSVDVTTVLGRLRDRQKRIAALQGDVEPANAEVLVAAARDIGEYIREDDLDALTRAHDRLQSVG